MGLTIINRKIEGGTPAQIRDKLLSLPENERKFVISDPAKGRQRITNIAVDTDTDEQIVITP